MAASTVGAAPRVVSRWNPANAVTASRYLTLPFLWWAVVHDERMWATLCIAFCGILDKLDGLVAKLFNCKSAFGELFDAITDGICYGFGLLLVIVHGWAPLIPALVVLLLGVGNTGLRGIYIRRAGRAINYKSYAMERVVAYFGYMIGFATSGMEERYFYWALVPVMIIIVGHDAKRMLLDPIPSAAAPAGAASSGISPVGAAGAAR